MSTFILGAIGTAQAAATPEQKCQQAKLKAQGKLAGCLAKNTAGVIGGKEDAEATCRTKFATALQKADDKAAAAEPPTSCRYLANGDGTVSDLNTGLMWEQKTGILGTPNPSDIHDINNTYSWSAGVGGGTMRDGTAFTGFLATLNNDTASTNGVNAAITGCFAGHCDWHMPSVAEGWTIAPIDPILGPDVGYWSASSWSADSSGTSALYLFGLGANKSTLFPVIAVRGGL